MHSDRINQGGYGNLRIIVACFIVAIVGISGVFFINHSHKAVARNSTLQTASQTTTPSDNTTSSQPVQGAQKYLVIKEWGVQLPYSSSDTFSYAVTAGGQSVTVGSAALASKDLTCATKGAGVIERFTPTDSASVYGGQTVADSAKQNPGQYAYINGYYYLFVPSQSACGSAISASDQGQANNVIKASLINVTSTN